MHRAALRRTDRFLLHDAKHNFTVFDHDEYAYAIIEPRVRRLGIRIMRDDGNPTRNHHAKDLPARSTRLKWRALPLPRDWQWYRPTTQGLVAGYSALAPMS